MNQRYTHLTVDERYQIKAYKKAGYSNREVALELGRHVSTINRELKRNQGLRGYRPKQAQVFYVDSEKTGVQNKSKGGSKPKGMIVSCLRLSTHLYVKIKRMVETCISTYGISAIKDDLAVVICEVIFATALALNIDPMLLT